MRRVLFLALLTLTWLTGDSLALAAKLPVTPNPVDCVAEPIDIAGLLQRAELSAAATPERPQLVDRPATAEAVDPLLDIVVASVACTNANQPLRALSYFTEDYLLYRISDQPAVTLGHLQAASTREPDVAAIEDRVTIEAVTGVGLADGRAQLEVTWSNGGAPEVAQLQFVVVDDHWKIDYVLTPIVD